jgi:transposase-like protein
MKRVALKRRVAMAARRRKKRWWQRLVRQLEERVGQVTVDEFAREVGVNRNTLVWWRSYLRREGRRSDAEGPKELRLLPVDVPEEDSATGLPQTAMRWLEAETMQGVRLRFSEGTGARYVAELLGHLAGGRAC